MPVPVLAPVVPAPAPVVAAKDKVNTVADNFLFTSKFAAPAGMYLFDLQNNGGKSRVHLRMEADSNGLLVVNAAKMIHLNPTAAQMAYQHFTQKNDRAALKNLAKVFNAPARQLEQDYLQVISRLDALVDEGSDLCPICDLGLDMDMPFSAKLSAPYRMDLALTYRCNNNCSHCYNARARSYPEMDTNAWKQVLDRIWQLRIPHVVFTGGEPTLRADLVELVGYAQKLGMVTGLNTNGRKLSDPGFVNELVAAGLDHVQITLESHLPAIHDEMVLARGAWEETTAGLRNCINSRLYVMTNTTLLRNNAPFLADTLNYLADLHVPTIGLNALIYSGRGAEVQTGLNESELPVLLSLAEEHCEKSGQRLIWYTPTQYCHFNPLLLQLGVKGCTAAYYNMCIEPDGQVIPCQSYYESLGHILKDSWDSVWNHPLALDLRERRSIPEGCLACDFLKECGGGCPLARGHQNIQPIPVMSFMLEE